MDEMASFADVFFGELDWIGVKSRIVRWHKWGAKTKRLIPAQRNAKFGAYAVLGNATGADAIRESEGFVSANQNKSLRIMALTDTTITVAETLSVESGPIAAFTMTRVGKKLINPAAGSLVKRYFTIEKYEILIDSSEIFFDYVWGAIGFSMSPNGMFTANPSWVGTGKFDNLKDGNAPSMTSPTQSTGEEMAAIDATLRMGGNDILDLTSFEPTIDASPSAPDVAASKFAPDVFMGSSVVSMNLTMLQSDLLDVADFVNETRLELSVLITAPGG